MRRLFIILALAIGTLTAVSGANAAILTDLTGSGVLVRHDDGYIITGTIRDADSHVVGNFHGQLIERTTGFNSCPVDSPFSFNCLFGNPPATCNLLGGTVSFNFSGEKVESTVSSRPDGRVLACLCKTDDPSLYDLSLWTLRDPSPTIDVISLGASMQQITPTLFKWSGLMAKFF